jgi:glutamate carboxypeptidase
MSARLEEWVALNTGSWNLPGLEAFSERLAEALRELDFEVQVQPGPRIELPDRGRVPTGPLVVARREARVESQRALRFLLSGHYDTVFEPGSEFQQLRIDPNNPVRAIGPGAADMKGGLIIMLEALRALGQSGDLDRASWTVVLNADEEIGSLGSRVIIEAEARQAKVGFAFEPPPQSGAMVRSRRGLGQFHLGVDGLASHAGRAHAEGRSAIHEMAAKILRIEALTDYERGLTVNVGTVQGGSKRNIVPERAEAWIDLRYDHPSLGEEARQALESVAAESVVEGTRGTLWGVLHRPPKLASPEVDRLLEAHAEVAEALGIELPPPVHAGGGTDGSLMGAVGLATLDSMGIVGGASHTEREFVDLTSLPQRTALAALLFRRLLQAQLYGPHDGR